MLLRFWGQRKKTQYLRDILADFRDIEAPMLRSPVQPICVVTRSHIAVAENSLSWRNHVLIPCLLVLCCSCFFLVKNFYTFWLSYESALVGDIKAKKIKYGGKYFLETENRNDIEIYYSVDASGELPLGQYLKYRYQNTLFPFFPDYIKQQYVDGLALLLYCIGIPILLVKIARFRRRAPLYFDRDRRLVYTWVKGQAWVQKFNQLEFMSNNHSLKFILYSQSAESLLNTMVFAIQPSGSLLFNGDAYYRPLFTAICQFMEKGMDRVWPEEWSDVKGRMLLSDPMPSDFYEQVEKTLEVIAN